MASRVLYAGGPPAKPSLSESVLESEPMLTIFTTPKPFRGLVDVIQRNALGSWARLDPEVEVLVIGDEQGAEQAARQAGARHLPEVERNELGTPLLNSIFELAACEARHPILCYANADILLLDDFLPAVRRAAAQFGRYLLVGQRWDLEVRHPLNWAEDWIGHLRAELARAGRRHPPAGSDYFVFPKGLFSALPPFALGRAGWDNWMIYAGRARGIPVVDIGRAVTVIHQSHDYSHLPGGEPHYRLPESRENVALAGGREVIFTLRDANWRLDEGGLRRIGWRETGLVRWLETGCVLRLGPGKSARGVRMVLHPFDTLSYLVWRLRGRPNPERQGRPGSAPRSPGSVGGGDR